LKYALIMAALLLSFNTYAQQAPPDVDFHLLNAPECVDSAQQIYNPLGRCGYLKLRNTYVPYHASKKMGCFTGDGKDCVAEVGKTYAMNVDVMDEEACSVVIHYRWQGTVQGIFTPPSWDPASQINWQSLHMTEEECTHVHPPCVNLNW